MSFHVDCQIHVHRHRKFMAVKRIEQIICMYISGIVLVLWGVRVLTGVISFITFPYEVVHILMYCTIPLGKVVLL